MPTQPAVALTPASIRANDVARLFMTERSKKILMTPGGGRTAREKKGISHTTRKRFGVTDELLGAVCWRLDDVRVGFLSGVTLPVD